MINPTILLSGVIGFIGGMIIRNPNVTMNGNGEKEDELIRASITGNIDDVNRLLAVPDINVNLDDKYGRNALIWASKIGHIDIVNSLLAHPRI